MSSSSWRRCPTVARWSLSRRSMSVVIVLFALYGVILPPTTVQADTAIDIVPLQSTVDVSNLPSPSPSTALLETTTKPFLTPDPDALRNWKELLRQVPGVVPPTPMMVDDPSPLVGAPTPSTSGPPTTCCST